MVDLCLSNQFDSIFKQKQNAMRSINIIYICVIISISSLSNCKGQQVDTTQNEKPLPEWLMASINDFEASGSDVKGQIDEYYYRSGTVYMVDFCKGCPDNLVRVFNIKGDILCEFGGFAGTNSCPDFETSARFEQTVWSK